MPMGHSFQAVIFDLDGTLLDTLADIAHAMNTTLVRHGLPPRPLDEYRLMVGSGLEALVRRAAQPEANRDLLGTLVGELRDAYAADPVSRTKPYEGIPELIDALRAMSVPLAVLSNKADELVTPIVAEFFRADDFTVVRGMLDGVPAKPDPSSAIGIANDLSVSPDECVYLGDSDVDMYTARNAGMTGIGAAWGFRGPDELRAAGARQVIAMPAELVRIVVEGISERQRIREGR